MLQPEEAAAHTFTFPPDIPAENVVRTVLVMLQAHHEREAERLNGILRGFSGIPIHRLTTAWERFRAECENDEAALDLLTQMVIAELSENRLGR